MGGADHNLLTKNGLNTLHCACSRGKINIVDYLLRKGVDANAVMKNGKSSLHLVSGKFMNVEIAKLLLEFGASPTVTGDNGVTPMHQACQEGNKDIILLLEQYGGKDLLEAKTLAGYTPLSTAVSMGQGDIAKLLIGKNVDTSVVTDRGYNLLHLCAVENKPEVAKYLLEIGISDEAVDNNGETPLAIAEKLNNVAVINVLKRESKKEAPSDDKEVKIDNQLVEEVVAKTIEVPVEAPAPVEEPPVKNKKLFKILEALQEKASDDYTPLHIAAKLNNAEVAQVLLDGGAQIDKKGKNKLTPLGIAIHYGSDDVAKLLIANGADKS